MTFIDFFRNMFSSKASKARIAMSIQRLGQPVNTPANYQAMSKEGYGKNAIAHACIKKIAQASAGIEWELFKKNGDQEIEESPILNLMEKPNPLQGWSQFCEAFVSYLLISGNSYIDAVGPESGKPPMELWTMRPDLTKVIPGILGYPVGYEFAFAGQKKTWEVDVLSGKSPILHMKTFNPLDIWYGMSPMEAAIYNIDSYNQANRWNLSLLQNSASPSGILKVLTSDANPSGNLTTEQYERMKEEFIAANTGSKNSGRPILLEGGVDWQSISLSPKDMEWLKGRDVSGIDICNIYGVPAEMLGLGQKTYSNYQEARLAFYEDTVLPLMDFIQFELNRWLVPMFGDGIELKYDKDDIEALVQKRESKYTSLVAANWLTINEKRLASGYKDVEGWDVFVIGNQILANPDEISNPDENTPESGAENGGTPNGEEETNEEEAVTEEGMQSEETDEVEKGWKSFNLLNQHEKQVSRQRVNKRQKRLEEPFARSLKADFMELAKNLGAAAKDKDPKLVEYAMQKVIDDGMKDIEKTLRKYIRFTVEDFGSQVFQNAKSELKIIETKKNEKTWSQWADKYVEKRTARAITDIEGTTRKQVRKVVQELVRESISEDYEGNMASDLQDKFESLSSGRARNIARTEVSMASNNATLEAAKSLEIPGLKKEWVSVQDNRTRDGDGPNLGSGPDHLNMNGVRVELDDKFTVPPDTDMDGPGDESAGADQVCNCRCTLVFTTGVRR